MPKPHRFRSYSVFHRRDTLSGASWTGTPTVLTNGANVNLPQTTNGTLCFAWMNTSKQNNAGSLTLTSGGGVPTALSAPALTNQPSILLKNWNGNNLSVTNTSSGPATPIWIALSGPGLPGNYPVPLPADGTLVSLTTLVSAQGMALARYMQLSMVCTSGTLAIVAIIGGPLDSTGNNGKVIGLNYSFNSGPDGPAPPAGYYATTVSNTYVLKFNWGAASIFVAAMSPFTTATVDVALFPL
jgi:hypothetical protein